MNQTLDRFERETVIVFNQEESTAVVETYSVKFLNRIRREIEQGNQDVKVLFLEEKFGRFELPKTWVKISPPKKVSDEQREAMRIRATERFGKKKDVSAEEDYEEDFEGNEQ